MSGAKSLWLKSRASETILSLNFHFREIDQSSGNLRKLVPQKFLPLR